MRLLAILALTGAAAAAYDSLVVQNYNGDNNRILKHATQVPVCANICIFQAAVAVGCDTSDYHCQCSSKRLQLRTLTESCLAKSCNQGQVRIAHRLTNKICKAVADGVRNPDVQHGPPPPVEQMSQEASYEEEEEDDDDDDDDDEDGEGAENAIFPDAPAPTDPPVMRRGLPAEHMRVQKRSASVASSIPSLVLTTPTSSPTVVATAGAGLNKAPSILVGVGAIAAAALMI